MFLNARGQRKNFSSIRTRKTEKLGFAAGCTKTFTPVGFQHSQVALKTCGCTAKLDPIPAQREIHLFARSTAGRACRAGEKGDKMEVFYSLSAFPFSASSSSILARCSNKTSSSTLFLPTHDLNNRSKTFFSSESVKPSSI